MFCVFVCVCVFLDLQLYKQLSQYCKDKFLLVALPLLKLYSWESASTDALSVSYSGDSLLVISKSLEVTYQDYHIWDQFFLPCLHLSDVHIFSQNRSPGWQKYHMGPMKKLMFSFCCCCIFQDFHEAWNSTIKFYFH